MRFSVLLILTITLFLLSACRCRTINCQFSQSIEINFVGYTNVANDSIIINYYEKATTFTNLVQQETVVIAPVFGLDSVTTTSLNLNSDFDYRITLQSDSNTFEITNYFLDKNYSNESCVPFFVSHKVDFPDCPIISMKVSGDKATLQGYGFILLNK